MKACGLSYCITICWLILCVHSKSIYRFVLTSVAEHLVNLEMYENTWSPIECAMICAQRRQDYGNHKMCEAHRYNITDKSCQLFSALKDGGDALGSPVYKYEVLKDEDTAEIFEYIPWAGQTYIYSISDEVHSYLDGREYCLSLGAYLLNINSFDEYGALKELSRIKPHDDYDFVGIRDVVTEGVWIHDRDNTPVDIKTWMFMPGEPNDLGHDENCAAFRPSKNGLSDVGCDYEFRTVCEKTP